VYRVQLRRQSSRVRIASCLQVALQQQMRTIGMLIEVRNFL